MLPLKVFINYRHDDTQGTAWALYMQLEARFGTENMFFDNGTLRPGMQWLDEIKSHLAGAGACIALIGSKWMPSLIDHLQRGGEDYVAKEIELALRSGSGLTVIPVLVDDAPLPDPGQLPPSIKALAGCHVERLRHTNLRDDIEHLIVRLGEIQDRASSDQRSPDQRPADPRSADDEPRSVDTVVEERSRPPVVSQEPGHQPPPSEHGPAEKRQVAPPPDDDHYQMVVDEADNIVVFLGAGVNADDHDEPWRENGGMLPDDRELARYLAAKARLKTEPLDLAEVAQYVRTIRGEPNVFRWVKEILAVDSEPGPVHRYLARFPARLEELGLERRYPMIVTTTYDAALERAFREVRVPFDVAVYTGPGTAEAGRFVHLPWDGTPTPITEPNRYSGFPITEGGNLMRTVIVRINGGVDDPTAGYTWKDNYVLTEDHYIDYLSGSSAEDLVPGQILAKLREASCLFLGYTMADWRLRVFLKRIWQGEKLGRATCWAIERDPDVLEREFWRHAGATLYASRLTDYVKALDEFLLTHLDELRA